MDPYHILGIQRNATQDEIKQAYRRLAMKWHPDRNQNSSEAKERFHEAAEAYKRLFDKASRGQYSEAGASWNADRQEHYSEQASDDDYRDDGNDSQDEFADTVFWEVMLDYAIKLAQTGMNEDEISSVICNNGCSERLARVIAGKAFNIHAHYASSTDSGKQRKSRPDRSTFKQERQDGELFRAFLGARSFVLSSRDATDYYLVVFRAFAQSTKSNPFAWISTNKRLMRILNFSIVLFAVIVLAIYYYPGPSEYKLLSDKQLLQLPFLILPLMFVWMLYRKLWSATLVLSLIYAVTVNYYNTAVPRELPSNLFSLTPVLVICFTPFVFTALFANFLYYKKAQHKIRQAKNLFTNHLDQMVWIKNRSGTSAAAAFLFALVFVAALIHLIPRDWEFSGQPDYSVASANDEYDEERFEKIRLKTSEARELFEIAESHFNASPPDYLKAEMAYSIAATNGSLLAAYKLGYMHYTGEGVDQNDAKAFDYFLQATRAPLAFQPHKLELTTSFLAESYFNLGIMYQDGLGTRKNSSRAREMFHRAAEFGASSAKRNPVQNSQGNARHSLALPVYQ
ncbi:MAG: DnaJ domain-containing protein [Gammaproteobacteria bacterium]|nr:DnaJ domain-containing protein [Gammaproteobacteria bacterium]